MKSTLAAYALAHKKYLRFRTHTHSARKTAAYDALTAAYDAMIAQPKTLDYSTPTATTVGNTIHWNPDWLATLTQAEVDCVVRHELLHLIHAR